MEITEPHPLRRDRQDQPDGDVSPHHRREIEQGGAEGGTGDLSSTESKNIANDVQSYIDDAKLSGAISMVARRGKVVHFETYGNMDDEAGKAAGMKVIGFSKYVSDMSKLQKADIIVDGFSKLNYQILLQLVND